MANTTDSKFLQTAWENLDAVNTALSNKIESAFKAEESTAPNPDAALEKLTAQITTQVLDGGKMTIPPEVYKKFAESVYEKIKSNSEIANYSKDDTTLTNQFLGQIYSAVSDIPDVKVPATITDDNGKSKTVNYTISFGLTGSIYGASAITATVSDGTNSAMLTLANKDTKVLAEYFAALHKLEEKLINQVWWEIGKLFLENAKEFKKLKKELTEVAYTDAKPSSELEKVLGNSFLKKLAEYQIINLIKNLLGKDSQIATSYGTLVNLYYEMKNFIAKDKNLDDKDFSDKVTQFTATAKSILGNNFVELPDPANDIKYTKNLSEITIPAGYGGKVDATDYNSKVKKIHAESIATALNLAGNNNANVIYSGSGADTLSGGLGKDTIYGGKGNDTIYGDEGHDKLFGDDGYDILYGGAGNDTLYGGKAADTLYGDEGNDKLYGDEGNDKLYGGAGNDSLYGGSGNDSLYGEDGNDKLFGEDGDDTLIGGAGNDTLYGGTGKDIFYYSEGDGNDVITDYTYGEDLIKIGSGNVDSYSVSGGKDAVLIIGKNKLTIKGVGNGKISYVNADNATITCGGIPDGLKYNKSDLPKATAVTIGSDYAEKVYVANSMLVTVDAANLSNNIKIVGNAKANKIFGGKANDTLNGGNGNDKLYGNAGADILYGENGNDSLYGGDSNDLLYGGAGNDKLFGENGDDILYGEIGNDILYGGEGNDTLYGGAGNDKLYGENGDDTLYGDAGNDTLTGGAGNDVFRYANGDGNDVITDYAAGDTIYIDGANSVSGALRGKDVTFKIGSGSIKLQKAKGIEVVLEYSNGTFEKYLDGKLTSSGTVSNIPDGATYYNGHYYKIYQDGMTWEDAKTFCENLGGHLVTITDADEQATVENLLRFYGNKNCYWLGGYRDSNNKWHWVTDESWNYTHWGRYQPDNYGRLENRLMIYEKSGSPGGSGLGFWNDLRGDCKVDNIDAAFFGTKNFGFICEWESDSKVYARTAENHWFIDDENFIGGTEIDSLIESNSVGEISLGSSSDALAQISTLADNQIDNRAKISYDNQQI